MGFLKVIRTWALRDKMPIREIARRTGISRNTIKKYLREGIVEPAFQTPDRPSKLDPYATQLTGWLVSDQRKSRKERRTAKLMHADLVKLGYDGSYERVAAFVREWKGERQRAYHTTDRGTFVPLVFAPGEAFQFDWSEDWAYVGGERIKLQVAHIKLSHSRALLVWAYLLQTHEMLFDAHWHAFRVFEGVPGRGIYDSEAWPPWVRGLPIEAPSVRARWATPNEDRRRQGRTWQEARCKCAVHGNDQPLCLRSRIL
ncbi:helix-turn-helix resolvase-like protein [Roseinatronobacter thiooxidans]|uniref:Helix-turn-helix resolvase-like protein n=1 Tax=Roseinatronobacter thiooxidans TaxID=121821 RepID=A0A2W7PL85_9RHOB|nr:helix-turn-helix resolvase-like protein [Roseinatronobacter thiooxidans]